MDFDHLRERAQARGLRVRGGFRPEPTDAVPQLADGREVGTVVMLGNAGGSFWNAFRGSPEAEQAEHQLDTWARRVIGELADELGTSPLFPFGGPPYLPFQRWARRAEAVHVSPLGLLIHPEYGLWHAYRAALAFAEYIALPDRPQKPSPCENCAKKPCLSACPVAAFGVDGYDVPRCVSHISRAEGERCIENACLARRACPVGCEFAYAPEQARFHMSAFLKAHS